MIGPGAANISLKCVAQCPDSQVHVQFSEFLLHAYTVQPVNRSAYGVATTDVERLFGDCGFELDLT